MKAVAMHNQQALFTWGKQVMQVSAINASSVTVSDLTALHHIDPVATLIDAIAPVDTSTLSVSTSASVVDISSLGQLLSAVSVFQNVNTAAANSSGTATGLSALVASTQQFINAFNTFQTSVVENTQTSSTFSSISSLLQEAQLLSPTTDWTALLSSLKQAGIQFQDTLTSGSGTWMSVDVSALQAAYAANAAETISLLTHTFQLLAIAATKLLGQSLALPGSTADVAATTTPNTASDTSAATFDLATLTSTLPTLNETDTASINATLQHLLASQALSNAQQNNATTTATATMNAATVLAPASTLTSANAVTSSISPATSSASAAASRMAAQTDMATVTTLPTLADTIDRANLVDAATIATGSHNAAATQNAGLGSAIRQEMTINADRLEEQLEEQALASQNSLHQQMLAASLQTPQISTGTLPGDVVIASVNAPVQAQLPAAANSQNSQATADKITMTTTGGAGMHADVLLIASAITTLMTSATSSASASVVTTSDASSTSGSATPISAATTSADMAHALNIDPTTAAAVAAYRLGNGAMNSIHAIDTQAAAEEVTDIVEVIALEPTTLELHSGPSGNGRHATTHPSPSAPVNASPAPAATSVPEPDNTGTVDVMA